MPYHAISSYGKVTTNTYNQVKACTSAGCKNCVNDFSICLNCDSNYFYLATTTTCYDDLTIPESYGKVVPDDGSTPTTLDSCTLSNCGLCKQDRTVCGGCIDPYYWKSAVPACVITIDPGFGLVPLTTIREIVA
jgi:hypothetical protein